MHGNLDTGLSKQYLSSRRDVCQHPPSQRFRNWSSAGSLAAYAAQRLVRAMATLMDAHLPSDDEEDEDFDPEKSGAGGGDGGGGGGKGGKGAKRGFMEVSDGSDDDDGGADAVAEGVHDMIAAGLANAMDKTRYCAAAGADEHDARPAGDQNSCMLYATSHPSELLYRSHAFVRTLGRYSVGNMVGQLTEPAIKPRMCYAIA